MTSTIQSKMTDFILRLFRSIIDIVYRIIASFIPDRKGLLPPVTDPILMMSATELAAKIRSRDLSSELVVKTFIERIKSTNHLVNSVVDSRFEDAIQDAQRVDQLLDSGKDVPSLADKPFLGVPYTGKDCMPVRGLVVTGGILPRAKFIADADCPVSKNMHDSGAICLGVTNVPESTFWFDSHNMIFGRTNNPYDLSCIPGGSSGGNAAAIAACQSPFGVGGDLAGSIRIPCFYCGIFGHKTTPGIVPTEGQYPDPGDERQRFLSFGPMTRYSCDLIPMLKAMAGSTSISKYLPDIDEAVDISSIKIYYMEDLGDAFSTPVTQEIRERLRSAVSHLKSVGCDVRPIRIPEFCHAYKIFFENMKVEGFYPSHGETLTDCKGPINGWLELVKGIFGKSNYTMSSVVFCLYQDHALTPIRDQTFLDMKEYLKKYLTTILAPNGVFLFPTHPETAIKHRLTLLKSHNPACYTGLFSVLELPATQCPLGLSSKGLPIGIQIISAPYQDRLTIGVASELEKAFDGWSCPSQVEFRINNNHLAN